MAERADGGGPLMSLPVLVAVSGAGEAPLVAGLEVPGSAVRVVRRCADLSELLSAAAAGLARAVVVSADLPRLDAEAVARLHELGLVVLVLVAPRPGCGRRLGGSRSRPCRSTPPASG